MSALVALAALGSGAAGAAEPTDPTQPIEVETGREYTGALAAGPEGSLWFVVDGVLGKVGSDGKVSETKLSEELAPVGGAAVGPEGDIWATTRDRVDRIAPDGTVTSFAMPKGSGEVGGVAVAADGTVWVTAWARRRRGEREFGKAFVVRFGADGTPTRFALPGAARRRTEAPGSIIAGPGGDIWFTDPSLREVGKIAPDGTITEYHQRLAPEVLAADGADKLWFAGLGGVGTIDGQGKVDEIRTGNFGRFSIGSNRGAVTGPEGDLWLIGEATRVLRVTPAGHVDVIRGTGSPTPTAIAASGGSIWVGTAGGYKGFTAPGPILRYATGLPGVEVRPGVAIVDGQGKVAAHLSCGGSTSGCAGEASMRLDRDSEVSQPYAMAAESEAEVSFALSPAEIKLVDEHGYLRVSVSAIGTGLYPGSTNLILRAAKAPTPRQGDPVVMPLPEDADVAGLAAGPAGTLWTGSDTGRFTKVTTSGEVSSVEIPSLGVKPFVIGSDAHHDVWFVGSAGPYFDAWTEPVIGRLEPDGSLRQRRLPTGPELLEAAVGANGEAWVLRAEPHRPGVIERLTPAGKLSRFKIGTEPTAVAVGRDGVWFAQEGSQVVHIDRAGKRRFFPLRHTGSVESLALGKGGAVWLGLGRQHGMDPAISRLDPDGKLVRHPVEGVGEFDNLLVAPNGRLWFSSEFTRRIGTMTPGGKVKLTRRGAAAGAGAVTIGPDGNVWFGDYEQETLAGFRP